MRLNRTWRAVVLAPLICAVSCGTDRTPPASTTGGSLPPPAGVHVITDLTLCQPGQLGRTALRRISRNEYNNMVRDLLGDTTRPADAFVSEQKVAGFNSNSGAPVDALITRQYLEAAETLAATATAADNLTTVVTCAAAASDACARGFIGDFAGRAFRGQLDDSEASSLFTLYKSVATQFDFASGIEAVITSVLSSPRFLFVLELGQRGAKASGVVVPLSPSEVATRLSLYLWRSLPDATLTQAAASGQLATADQIEAQAARMLADPRAADGVEDFANQWLQLENMDSVTKDASFGNWPGQIAKDLHTETLTTYRALVLSEHAGLADLLTSPYAYVNDATAWNIYRIDQTDLTNDAFVKRDMNPDPVHPLRAGIFTEASVLASHAHRSLPSPTLRGKLVSTQLLCNTIPAPPADPDIGPPPMMEAPGQTIRDYYEQHHIHNKPSCYACHQHMDLIGFGFGDFDATGAVYEGLLDNGQAIDDSGEFVSTSADGPADLDGPFHGPVDMMTRLAASAQVRECMALQQFRYAFGRPEADADACSAQDIYSAFSASDFNLQALIIAVVRSEAFRTRTVSTAGAACQ
jgi:hypothetical protein